MTFRSIVVLGVVCAIAAALLTGCSTSGDGDRTGATTDFPGSGRPDYQLGGAYSPPAGVTIVERDSTAHPAPGRYSICYVNGFQTQPEDADDWLERFPDAVLRGGNGRPVADPGWPDEMLLDTGSSSTRSEIVRGLQPTIARCAKRGFDAVEFDNLDSWTRSHGLLTRAGNVALATALVRVAHRLGLAAGQKNTPQLGASGRVDIGFDFAVAEECIAYQECAAYTRTYGQRVIDVEYSDALHGSWASACAVADRPRMTILRDRELLPATDPDHVYEHC